MLGRLLRWALVLIVIAAALAFFLSQVQNLMQVPGEVVNFVGSSLDNANATPTIIASSRTVVRDVQRLAIIESGRYNIEKVITAESRTDELFSFLVGDRLLFVAVGYVTAGVDLSQLALDDIQVTNGERVVVQMPNAQLIDCYLDVNESYVFTREQALFAGNIDLETQARRAALVEIRDAALEAGILAESQQQAQRVVESLLLSLGYSEVIFDVTAATPDTALSPSCYGDTMLP